MVPVFAFALLAGCQSGGNPRVPPVGQTGQEIEQENTPETPAACPVGSWVMDDEALVAMMREDNPGYTITSTGTGRFDMRMTDDQFDARWTMQFTLSQGQNTADGTLDMTSKGTWSGPDDHLTFVHTEFNMHITTTFAGNTETEELDPPKWIGNCSGSTLKLVEDGSTMTLTRQ